MSVFASLCRAQSEASAEHKPVAKPNFIIVLADDLGWGDLACMGHPIAKTPHLDRFAAEGMRFNQFYAGAPICSPSRAALITGRSAYRVGVYDLVGSNSAQGGRAFPVEERTLGEILKSAGYRTFLGGKWHLSPSAAGTMPAREHGFGGKDTFKAKAGQLVEELETWLHLTRGLSDEAPFFAFLSLREVHEPVVRWSTQEQRERYSLTDASRMSELPNGGMQERETARQGNPRSYLGAISAMDDAMGDLIRVLEKRGLRENTVVLFTSDNGPESSMPNSFGTAGPLRGAKGTVFEGGIRVPTFMQWPGKVKGGTISEEPLHFVDVLPTFCAAAGVQPEAGIQLDGENFLPLLTGESFRRQRPLYWNLWHARGGYQVAMRRGKWKILAGTGPIDDEKTVMEHIREAPFQDFALYDLEADPTESRELSAESPSEFASMKQALEALHREIVQAGPQVYLEDRRGKGRSLNEGK